MTEIDHIFGTRRPTNFKLGIWMEYIDRHDIVLWPPTWKLLVAELFKSPLAGAEVYCGGSTTGGTACYNLSVHFSDHFPGEPGLAGVYWSKGWWQWWWQLDCWSYKSCSAPVTLSPPTNHHPGFLQAGCSSWRPFNSVETLKGKISHSMDLIAYPKHVIICYMLFLFCVYRFCICNQDIKSYWRCCHVMFWVRYLLAPRLLQNWMV